MARKRSYGRGSRSSSGGTGSKSYSSGTGSKSYSTEGSSFKSKTSHPMKPAEYKKVPRPAKAETTYGGSNFGHGFRWGFGHAMGQRFFDAIFGPRTIKGEIALPKKAEVAAVSAKDDTDKSEDYSTGSCNISYKEFQDCLNVKGNDLSKCHSFMDSLFECKKNSQLQNSWSL